MDDNAKQIRRKNLELREELARDVRALEHRLDVKQRVRERLHKRLRHTRARMTDDRPVLLGVALVGTLATLIVALGVRRRHAQEHSLLQRSWRDR